VVVTDTLVTVLELDGLNSWAGGMGQASNILSQFGGNLNAQQQKMLGWAGAAATGAGLIAAALGKTVQDAGKMEQVEIAFTSLEGSAEGAAARIAELQRFDAVSPFNFEEIAKGAQMLRGFGAEGAQIVPIMTALGNAVSASGNIQAFPRALLAVGQVISRGKLQGDELNQLAEAGVPLNEVLKELGATAGDVGKKGITSTQFIDALMKVMSQGKFAGAMEAQSRTLNGSLSTLSGAFFKLSASVGKTFLPALTGVVRSLTWFVDTLNNAPPIVKSLIGLVGAGLAGSLLVLSGIMLRNIYLANAYAAANGRLAASLAAVGTASRGSSAGMAASGAGGFLGKAGGLLGKLGGPLALLGAATGIGGTIADGMKTGDWAGAPRRALGLDPLLEMIGLRKPGTAPAGGGTSNDPVLAELKKQTELQSKQLAAMEGENSLPTDFIPLGIQRSMTKRFARAAR
jgi:tape measure domain-containing protein